MKRPFVRKTVIIAPIRIMENGNGTIQITWGCNRGAFCKDENCRHSETGDNIVLMWLKPRIAEIKGLFIENCERV